MSVKDNLKSVLERIENAKIRTGRKDDIKLIAVTKTIEDKRVLEAIDAGVTDIGENRPQALVKRVESLGSIVSYHMIGRLQTNKVKQIIGDVKLIHSLDRMSLAMEIEKRAKYINKPQACLLQVNVSGEKTKTGFKPEELLIFIEEIGKMPYINIKGLMTMAPFTDNKKIIRQVFRELVNLRDEIIRRGYSHVKMDYLSMGMSQDFEIAIEEGANMLRIGSSIFGQRR